jgi:hypothetical protein
VSPAADCPPVDEVLPDVERSFFDESSSSVPPGAAESELDADDVDTLLLTPAQQQRRQWFRRQVMALVAGMGAFGTAAVAVRIASLL